MTSNSIVRDSLSLLIAVMVVASAPLGGAAVPDVASVSPSRGPTTGGTPVVIAGTGFTGATAITFGGAASPNFVVVSDTTITATTPAHPAGLVSVTVGTPEGSDTVDGGFGFGTIPLALNDSYSTPFTTALAVGSPGVLLNDSAEGGGGVVTELGTNVTNGMLSFDANGGFTYVPNSGFAGTDTFTYRSRNNTGAGNYATVSITVVAPAGPQPPTGLYASTIRGNLVTLRWTPPAIGSTPTNFVVEGGPNPGDVLGTLTAGPNPVFTFTAPTGSFHLRVHTVAGPDRSAASNEIRIFVNVPIVPSAPTNVLALVSDMTLSLAWRNTFAGGEPTSLALDVTGSVNASLPLGLVDTAVFTGVPAGTYTLSLRALNGAGSGFPSQSVTVTFPGPCSGPPLAPTEFIAFRVGNTINVLWQPPATGPAPTSYVLNVSGGFVGSFPTTARQMSGNVSPGSYTLSVFAINACGGSAATTPRTVTVP